MMVLSLPLCPVWSTFWQNPEESRNAPAVSDGALLGLSNRGFIDSGRVLRR